MNDLLKEPVKSSKQPPFWVMAISFTALLGFLFLIGWGLREAKFGPIQVGQDAPDFRLVSFQGETLNKDDFAGKIVVINFWSSWCLPCDDEASILQTSWQYFQPQGDVVFLGIDYADTPTEAQRFLNKNRITYPNGMDMGTRIAKAYRIRGVPETFILGRDGKVVWVQIGPFDSVEQLVALIKGLE